MVKIESNLNFEISGQTIFKKWSEITGNVSVFILFKISNFQLNFLLFGVQPLN